MPATKLANPSVHVALHGVLWLLLFAGLGFAARPAIAILAHLGTELPRVSQWAIAITNFGTSYWFLLAPLGVLLALAEFCLLSVLGRAGRRWQVMASLLLAFAPSAMGALVAVGLALPLVRGMQALTT